MATKKLTGIPEIDMIASAFAKKFGKEEVLTMGPKYEKVEPISTGSVSLDSILGIGGVPDDRIIEVFGPPSAGKTSLCLQIVRNYVQTKGYSKPPVWIDLERTTGLDLVESMGLDPDKMIFVYPDTAEEALQLAQDLGKTGKVGIVVFDSIDAAQSEKETKRNMNEVGVADLPRLLSKALRSISKISVDNKVCYLFINQVRTNIGVMYGNPETTSGGNAIPFYASVRMRVSSKPSQDQDNALTMRVKVIKNKCAPALNKEASFDFVPGIGTDRLLDAVTFCKDNGLIRFAGSSVKYTDPDTGVESSLCTGGRVGMRDYLEQNPTFFEKLKEQILNVNKRRSTEIENPVSDSGTESDSEE